VGCEEKEKWKQHGRVSTFAPGFGTLKFNQHSSVD
jgi:hypothetical protein